MSKQILEAVIMSQVTYCKSLKAKNPLRCNHDHVFKLRPPLLMTMYYFGRNFFSR